MCSRLEILDWSLEMSLGHLLQTAIVTFLVARKNLERRLATSISICPTVLHSCIM